MIHFIKLEGQKRNGFQLINWWECVIFLIYASFQSKLDDWLPLSLAPVISFFSSDLKRDYMGSFENLNFLPQRHLVEFFGNLGPVVIWFSYSAFKQNPPLWMFPLLPYKLSNISDYWLYYVSIIECFSFITKEKKIYKKNFREKDLLWWPKNTKFPFFLSLNIWDRAKHYTVAQKPLSLTFLSLLA